MELQTLLGELKAGGFALGLSGCTAIELRGPTASLTPELRSALVSHKPVLLALLGAEVAAEREAIQGEAEVPADGAGFPFGANTRCVAHLDPGEWEERPATGSPGWIRTTCRQCGTFIGYRPGGEA